MILLQKNKMRRGDFYYMLIKRGVDESEWCYYIKI